MEHIQQNEDVKHRLTDYVVHHLLKNLVGLQERPLQERFSDNSGRNMEDESRATR